MSNEQQARKDAMADAETLMPMVNDYARQVRLAIKAGDEFWAAECAERNAHAAFRAVPALRGEK